MDRVGKTPEVEQNIVDDAFTTDIIVVGSGAAALTAALTAAASGRTVRIIEKTAKIGGTSAMSGGMTWLPANHYAQEAGFSDTPEEALQYIRQTAPAGWGETEDPLWASQVENGPAMLKLVEAHSPLRFKLTSVPDPFQEVEGAKSTRILSVEPISRKILGPFRKKIRRSTVPQRLTFHETVAAKLDRQPIRGTLKFAPTIVRRWLTDSVAQGNGLIVGLLKGCVNLGCLIELESRAVEFTVSDAGVVDGVKVERGASRVCSKHARLWFLRLAGSNGTRKC